MRAGDLDRMIVIESVGATQSSSGDPTESWSTFATVWAKVIPVNTAEGFSAQQFNAKADVIFRIRHIDNLTPAMRINYNSHYYDITGITEMRRRESIEIAATVRRQ